MASQKQKAQFNLSVKIEVLRRNEQKLNQNRFPRKYCLNAFLKFIASIVRTCGVAMTFALCFLSASSLFVSRASPFSESSSLHQTFCLESSTSSVWSFWSFSFNIFTIFSTATFGTCCKRTNKFCRLWLSSSSARFCRNCMVSAIEGERFADRRRAKDDALANGDTGVCELCRKEGFLKISMAFFIAWISSARTRCRSAKSLPFTLHSTDKSFRYFSSASKSAITSDFLASASALRPRAESLKPDFFSVDFLLTLISLSRLLSSNSWVFFFFVSALSTSAICFLNWSCKSSKTLMMLPDWNS